MRAFTLIELLVVITIITVLLALLTPALDTAIYQAELAACGASLDAGATGILNYTLDQKRAYPDRGPTGYAPCMFQNPNFDQRVRLGDYLSINGAFNDPLSQKVDYADPVAGAIGYTARFFWYGRNFPDDSGMYRLGQQWTWTDGFSQTPARRYSFKTLLSDIDMVADNNQVWGSHPDDAGLMLNSTYQNTPPPEHELAPGMGVNRFIMSRWWKGGGAGQHNRGLVDLNFASTDGSVERHSRVAWTELILGGETGPLRGVPWPPGEEWTGVIRCAAPRAD